MRWDIIDRFEYLKRSTFSRAIKSYTGKEDFFSEHNPGRPLVPEPLFIEMIAHAGGVLYGLEMDFKKEVILAKIDTARFISPVAPPCELVIEATLDEAREEAAWIRGTVSFKDEVVAEARIFLVSLDPLSSEPGKKVVFNELWLSHFDIYNIAKKSEGKVI